MKATSLLLEGAFETFRVLKKLQFKSNIFYIAPTLALKTLLKTSLELYEHETKCIDSKLCLDESRLELVTAIVF